MQISGYDNHIFRYGLRCNAAVLRTDAPDSSIETLKDALGIFRIGQNIKTA